MKKAALILDRKCNAISWPIKSLDLRKKQYLKLRSLSSKDYCILNKATMVSSKQLIDSFRQDIVHTGSKEKLPTMIFAKLEQFVSCDTVGEIETVQAELVMYLQSVCLSLPRQPAAPGNKVSNLLFMYDMEQLLYGNLWLSSLNEMCCKMFVQNFDNKKIIYLSLLPPIQTWDFI